MKRSIADTDEISQPSKKVFLNQRRFEENSTWTDSTNMTCQHEVLHISNNSDICRVKPVRYSPTPMETSEDIVMDVFSEYDLNSILANAVCNFVKRPGHIYHLYERSCGEKYFSLLSPQEWGNAPHKYIGSWKLETDHSWTNTGREPQYKGPKILRYCDE